MTDKNIIDFVRKEEIKNWREGLVYRINKTGGTIDNVLYALKNAPEWKEVIRFNSFSGRAELHGKSPLEGVVWKGTPIVWDDDHDVAAWSWCHKNNIPAPRNTVGAAVMKVARESPYHPVKEYLEGLTWDKVPRLENWLLDYIGADAEDCPDQKRYLQQIGARWLISSVARIFEPGCKADHMLVIEGDQGIGKSALLRLLFEPWFTDCLPKLDSKDAAQATMGFWGIEIAEMSVWNKSDAEEAKSYIARQHENVRLPYDKHNSQWPRQCVFAGTINPTLAGYLKDPTGNRRYWVVEANEIDLKGVRRDRDQLFAEAVERYRTGSVWHLDERSLILTAQREQEKRVQVDPWEEPIREYVRHKEIAHGPDILDAVLNIETARQTQTDWNRVGRILTGMGWKRVSRRVNGELKKVWLNPNPPPRGVLM